MYTIYGKYINLRENFDETLTNIKLIHVGKCGGSSLTKMFKLKEFHLVKPQFNQNTKYIICIRNPIKRFVSAFNQSYRAVTIDKSKLNIDEITFNNSGEPYHVKKMLEENKNFVFDQEYDNLIKYFGSASNLAESLTSSDKNIREKALLLMNHEQEHIFKGIGWYLNNGEFVEKYNKNILSVIKQENFSEDVTKLCTLLGKNIPEEKERVTNSEKEYMSPLALNNIVNFYKLTDYKALETLYKFNFIDSDTLNSYYKY